MSENELLISAFKKVAELKPDIKTYAYDTGNWLEFAVDDYDFYRENESFKALANEIREEFFNNFGIKVVFVYRSSSENVLEALNKKLKEKNRDLKDLNSLK
jgi:3-dehydroquinate dehydratase